MYALLALLLIANAPLGLWLNPCMGGQGLAGSINRPRACKIRHLAMAVNVSGHPHTSVSTPLRSGCAAPLNGAK